MVEGEDPVLVYSKVESPGRVVVGSRIRASQLNLSALRSHLPNGMVPWSFFPSRQWSHEASHDMPDDHCEAT